MHTSGVPVQYSPGLQSRLVVQSMPSLRPVQMPLVQGFELKQMLIVLSHFSPGYTVTYCGCGIASQTPDEAEDGASGQTGLVLSEHELK